jgi:hypothetical protein
LKIYKQLEKHKDFTVHTMSEWSWGAYDEDDDL